MVKAWDEEAAQAATRLYDFLSQSDVANLPGSDKKVVNANSSNWYGMYAADTLEALTQRYENSPVYLAGGVGTRSSARARELKGEVYELLEHLAKRGSQLDLERVTTYVDGNHTRDNMEWIAGQVDPDAAIVIYEAAALPRRSKATLEGALEKEGKENDVYMVCAGPASLQEFVALHHDRMDVVSEIFVEEIDRLVKYAVDEPPKYPAAFTEEQAWAGAENFGGRAALQKDAEILKEYYDADGLKKYHKALDSDESSDEEKAEALRVLAPRRI